MSGVACNCYRCRLSEAFGLVALALERADAVAFSLFVTDDDVRAFVARVGEGRKPVDTARIAWDRDDLKNKEKLLDRARVARVTVGAPHARARDEDVISRKTYDVVYGRWKEARAALDAAHARLLEHESPPVGPFCACGVACMYYAVIDGPTRTARLRCGKCGRTVLPISHPAARTFAPANDGVRLEAENGQTTAGGDWAEFFTHVDGALIDLEATISLEVIRRARRPLEGELHTAPPGALSVKKF